MTRRLAILCGVLALSLGLRAWLSAAPQVPLRAPLSTFPAVLGAWELTREDTFNARLLAVLQTDDYLSRTYQNSEGHVVDLYIGYFENQRTGETMHSPKNCLPGSGWQALESGRVLVVPANATVPVGINRYLIEKDGQRALVLYWYQAHGRIIASEYWGKIFLVWDSLRWHRRDGALIRVVIPVENHLKEAETTGLDFVHLLLPQLPRYLPD